MNKRSKLSPKLKWVAMYLEAIRRVRKSENAFARGKSKRYTVKDGQLVEIKNTSLNHPHQ